MIETTTPQLAVTTATATAATYHLLGMPIEAVVIGMVASAAVMLKTQERSVLTLIAGVLIGGILSGAVSPPIAHILIEHHLDIAVDHPTRLILANIAVPALVADFH